MRRVNREAFILFEGADWAKDLVGMNVNFP